MGILSCVGHSATPRTEPIRLLCPWDSPGKSTGVGCHFLLQGIFPTQDFQMALAVKKSPANAGDIRDVGSILGSGKPSGGGHGNPLWYSCLENPMDRRAWWVTVHRATVRHHWSDLALIHRSKKKRGNRNGSWGEPAFLATASGKNTLQLLPAMQS